jgi:hypothetical protein
MIKQSYVDMLHSLLHDLAKENGKEPGFIDLSELSNSDKAFALITTCAELAGSTIWLMSGGDRQTAKQGLEILLRDLTRITLEEQR